MSSLYHLKDAENANEDAGFFVFPDLSVRTEGSYRLKLSLFEVVGYAIRCDSIKCDGNSPVAWFRPSQIECLPLQVDILRTFLRVHSQEVPWHGGCVICSVPLTAREL